MLDVGGVAVVSATESYRYISSEAFQERLHFTSMAISITNEFTIIMCPISYNNDC